MPGASTNGESDMSTVSISIDGMSCGHCVAAVRKALESVEGITVDSVSIGKAVVQAQDDAPVIDAMLSAVEDAGYTARVAQG